VCIDEAQDWPSELLRYLYQVVIWPTLADVGGRTVLGGTGTAPRGFWYEFTRRKDVSVHHWTMFENTLGVSDGHAVLAKAIADKGIEVVDLTEVIATKAVGIDAEIAQEYFCAFVAGEKQIFSLQRARNAYEALPAGEWFYVVGVDWGTVDACAVVVWGWTPASPKLHLIAYESETGLSSEKQIALAMGYIEKYPPLAVVADPATGGSAFILDLQERFGVPAEAAEKDGKVSAVLLMRDAFRRGDAVLPASEFPAAEGAPAGKLVTALHTPEWDITQVQKSIKGHMPDLCDAALYAFRKARHFDYQPPCPRRPRRSCSSNACTPSEAARDAMLRELLG
jgi:hypothetical protein